MRRRSFGVAIRSDLSGKPKGPGSGERQREGERMRKMAVMPVRAGDIIAILFQIYFPACVFMY